MNTLKSDLARLIKQPVYLLGLGFGTGLSRKAPGTVGTLAAIPLYLLMQHVSLALYLLIVVAAFVAGVWICERTAHWLNQQDPSAVVWDEMVGYWVTMIAAPNGWQWLLLGFVLFRFFDILKPWPISLADRSIHGGLGIMLDDLLAGICSFVIIQWIYHVYPTVVFL